MFLQNFEEGKPIHSWHFQVERDDVWLESQNLVARPVGIAGSADHFNLGIIRKRIADCASGQCGIIHNQHSDLARPHSHGRW